MKFYLVASTIMMLIATSCSKDDNVLNSAELEKATLSFGPELIDHTNKAGLKQSLDNLPECTNDEPSYVMIILSQDGTDVVGTEGAPFRVNLAPNQDFTVEAPELQLSPGQYSLDYFAVHNGAGDLIWIAPNDGMFSSYFDDPMPINIELGAGVKKYVEVAVMCFDNRFVNEYGYLFFDLETSEAMEFCLFANYCNESGRHYPAAFSVDIWLGTDNSGTPIYSNSVNSTSTQGEDPSAQPLCFALPNLSEFADSEDYIYFEITLLDWEGVYGNIENEVITGTLSREDIQANFEEDGSVNYEHIRFGCEVENPAQFSGPLFDLEILSTGDILVADASAGIKNLSGSLLVNLPGVNALSQAGIETIWATTGPPAETTMDVNQRLYRIINNNAVMVANLFEFEATYNPDGEDVNSNPFDVQALSENLALVIDAGANDLLRIDNEGNIDIAAIFPSEVVSTENIKSIVGCPGSADDLCDLPPMMPAQAVPTSIVIGPDGYYYVGELKGFPAPTGASNIWRIAPGALNATCGSSPDCVKAFDGGFTSIIDMKFGEDGLLYVAEMDSRSWFAMEVGQGEGGRIQACDPQTLDCDVIASGIPMLTAITIDENGELWATRNSLVPGMAEVVKVPL
ncbi:ScyD/ScyE family protein [Salinimicrobium sp. GXAS 041]|uniref:ScyD/ScyE family protein n=1 Tax=Salinimicrobium sp. GXAS 041 TaxID=3400806 RepID=UPI003C741C2C